MKQLVSLVVDFATPVVIVLLVGVVAVLWQPFPFALNTAIIKAERAKIDAEMRAYVEAIPERK
jgi:hypothetical protein